MAMMKLPSDSHPANDNKTTTCICGASGFWIKSFSCGRQLETGLICEHCNRVAIGNDIFEAKEKWTSQDYYCSGTDLLHDK